jgi:hypothetical protein
VASKTAIGYGRKSRSGPLSQPCDRAPGLGLILSIVNAVLLRPLPFKDSDRVVYIQGTDSPRPGVMIPRVRAADLPTLRQASQTLSSFSILLTRVLKLEGFGGNGVMLFRRHEALQFFKPVLHDGDAPRRTGSVGQTIFLQHQESPAVA